MIDGCWLVCCNRMQMLTSSWKIQEKDTSVCKASCRLEVSGFCPVMVQIMKKMSISGCFLCSALRLFDDCCFFAKVAGVFVVLRVLECDFRDGSLGVVRYGSCEGSVGVGLGKS